MNILFVYIYSNQNLKLNDFTFINDTPITHNCKAFIPLWEAFYIGKFKDSPNFIGLHQFIETFKKGII